MREYIRIIRTIGVLANSVPLCADGRSVLGERSPLSSIYDLDGYILLLGVRRNVADLNNTMLHLAERRALGDDQKTIPAGALILWSTGSGSG